MLANLLNPPVLFFLLGIFAARVRSDLDIPAPLPKFLSLYLLLSIGFRGGVELHKSGLSANVGLSLALAFVLALAIPVYAYAILKRRLGSADAAATAATFGSVSAVTFIAATEFLNQLGIAFGGHMVAAMALMESPAIVVGVCLARLGDDRSAARTDVGSMLREAVLNGSVLVLIGSLMIGLITGSSGEQALKPFTGDIFKGVLSLFLLDMGLVAGRRLGDLNKLGGFLVGFAVLLPLVNAALSVALARVLGINGGDAFLLCVLAASASYIAVPAAMRLAVPQASPGIYLSMALAITFPFNLILGLPLYHRAIETLWR